MHPIIEFLLERGVVGLVAVMSLMLARLILQRLDKKEAELKAETAARLDFVVKQLEGSRAREVELAQLLHALQGPLEAITRHKDRSR